MTRVRAYYVGKGWHGDPVAHRLAALGQRVPWAGRRKELEKAQRLAQLRAEVNQRVATEQRILPATVAAPLAVGPLQPIENTIPEVAEVGEISVVSSGAPVASDVTVDNSLASAPTPDEYEQYAEESPLGQEPTVERIGTELETERQEQIAASQEQAALTEQMQNEQNEQNNAYAFRKDRLRRRLVHL